MQPKMSRRFFLKNVGMSAAVAASFYSCSRPGPGKPNIIYILADDLGYGDLGCFGQQKIETPNLDKMAAEGMRFTDHYAGSTVCAPSRCTLMTGKHTGHARIRGNALVALQPQDETIAGLLKTAGYATALVGKWGLGEAGSSGIPTKKGFDSFFGYLNQIKAHNYYPEYLWRDEKKVYLNNEVKIADRTYAKGIGGASTKQVDYSHDLFTQEAHNVIKAHSGEPFFLYLAYTIPHANDEHWILNTHGMEVPDYGIYKDKEWPEAEKGYAAMISRMDRDIGGILQQLADLGIDKNTLVIFTSDNGPHKEGLNDPAFFDSNGPLRGIKRDLYEGGIRVPMIARWPGVIAAGTTSDLPSAFWDMMPTFAEAAGVTAPDDSDGISILPTLLGKRDQQQKHDFLYWEFHERGATEQAVRMGDWKAVRHDPKGPIELYDLSADSAESNNVAAEHKDVLEKIDAYLSQCRTPSKEWPLISKMN